MTKLTVAQRRALEAVRDGKIVREYKDDGNVFLCPPGIGSRAVLWKLEKLGLIREGRSVGLTMADMDLTDNGRMALRQAEEQTS